MIDEVEITMEKELAVIKILRQNANSSESSYEEYKVPFKKSKNVLQVLLDIYDYKDRSLAFRRNRCNRGMCGSCIMVINGKVRRACITKMMKEMIIEPAKQYECIKDLVTNFYTVNSLKNNEK
ncbi:MAG: succinate dehydrogenase / fumarate reductase, iron-sulfur subunit [Clostridiales bacterium]|nr:succinate dehydrogenase / fumarate reductase, iron-sulfur subunit [Clostridiales bacterium]MDK2933245.1 succinate dehydrogenase / fumarate reductase, iron-sulfur subunit [Clostridiales bacterium]